MERKMEEDKEDKKDMENLARAHAENGNIELARQIVEKYKLRYRMRDLYNFRDGKGEPE